MQIIKTCCLILLPVALFAQNKTLVYDTYMHGQQTLYQFNGNVLVAKKGEIIYKKSFGYNDYKTKRNLDENTIFDIGSIAKEFTSVGILLLKDKGLLNYDDTLRKYFPELPYNNITIRQLLTHTSGVPDGYDVIEEKFDHSKIATNDDLLRLLAEEKPIPNFNPGQNLMYSGTGFNLLASIIEKVSGQSYSNFLNQNIFKPLKMVHTSVANFPRNNKNLPGLSKGFIYNDSTKTYQYADNFYKNWATYFSGITGEGMIISTTGDLLKWDRALKECKILSPATQAEMTKLQAEKKGIPPVKFGFGIRVGANTIGNYVFHNGWYPGFSSMLIRYTDQDVTVIVLSNNLSHSEFIADGLATIAENKKILMPYVHKEYRSNTDLKKYAGKYLIPLTRPPYMVDFPAELIIKNDNLYLHTAGSIDILLQPESAEKFFYNNGTDQQIEFKKDRSGGVTQVLYTGYGVQKEIKKIN